MALVNTTLTSGNLISIATVSVFPRTSWRTILLLMPCLRRFTAFASKKLGVIYVMTSSHDTELCSMCVTFKKLTMRTGYQRMRFFIIMYKQEHKRIGSSGCWCKERD